MSQSAASICCPFFALMNASNAAHEAEAPTSGRADEESWGGTKDGSGDREGRPLIIGGDRTLLREMDVPVADVDDIVGMEGVALSPRRWPGIVGVGGSGVAVDFPDQPELGRVTYRADELPSC